MDGLVDDDTVTSGSVGSPMPTPTPTPTPSPTCEVHDGKNNNGRNIKQATGVTSATGCCDACRATAGCIGYTWVKTQSECWLKDQVDGLVDDDTVTSGSVGGAALPQHRRQRQHLPRP